MVRVAADEEKGLMVSSGAGVPSAGVAGAGAEADLRRAAGGGRRAAAGGGRSAHGSHSEAEAFAAEESHR